MLSKLLLSWLVTSQVTDYELIPGGCNIRVTEENKHEYVDRVAEHRLTTAIRPQITAFLEGFNELVAHELISIFNDKEMELLISGLPEIDCKFLLCPKKEWQVQWIAYSSRHKVLYTCLPKVLSRLLYV
jgi:hypothetical protein